MLNKLTLLTLVACGISACSVTGKTNGAGGHCTSNSDCAGTLVCSNDACVTPESLTAADGGGGGASDGGAGTAGSSAGTSDAGASSGSGSSSGLGSTSSSGSGSTSSAGSGSSSSAGSSSGSSSGTGSTIAHARLINALPAASTVAIDLCIESSGETTFTKVATNVIAGASSSFFEVPAATATLHVIATGGACTAAALIADQAHDFSATSMLVSIVAAGDTTTVQTLSIAASQVPTTPHAVNLAVVNATGATISFHTPLPYADFTTTASTPTDILAGAVSLASLTGFGSAFTIATHDYAKITGSLAAAATTALTIVPLADAVTHKVLVCDADITATAGADCVTITPAADQGYVRLANLLDSGLYKLCGRTAPSTVYEVGTANVAQVSAFVSVNASDELVYVLASAGCAAADFTATTFSLTHHEYGTVVLYKVASSVTAASYQSQPTTSLAGSVSVTVFNGVSVNDSFDIVVPQLGNLDLVGDVVAQGAASVALDVSDIVIAHLDGQYFYAADGDGPKQQGTVNLSILPSTSSTGFSVLQGGPGSNPGTYVLICADDGSIDATGTLSLCATTALSAFVSPNDSVARIVNTSAAAKSFCVNGVAYTGNPVAAGASTGYLAGVDNVSELPCADSAATTGEAKTYVWDGNILSENAYAAPTARNSNQATLLVINGIQGQAANFGVTVALTDGSSTTTPATISNEGSHAYNTALTYSAVKIAITTNTTARFLFPFPSALFAPGNGTAATVILGGTDTAPLATWCSEDFATSTPASSCTSITGIALP